MYESGESANGMAQRIERHSLARLVPGGEGASREPRAGL
jgi:hypothetical protein